MNEGDESKSELNNHWDYASFVSGKVDVFLNKAIHIQQFREQLFGGELNEPYYFVLLLDGAISFSLDFQDYGCSGKNLLFLSPYQLLKCHDGNSSVSKALAFHGDFYCIEYHKEEVACNGILFNNIYESPFVPVPDAVFQEITDIFAKILAFDVTDSSCDLSIVKSYLQVILALSSREKQLQRSARAVTLQKEQVSDFQLVLEEHFVHARSVSFYASHYGLSVDVFSKKIKNFFAKPPSRLIQERLVLESKKRLHLTHKNIKEIASELCFEDEFYFSRFFKKQVGVSPKAFREHVGISIVAK